MSSLDLFEERALRADARRNLARILEAARAVFAEEGSEATVAQVAARAGVGTATIFRRFPTKDDLLVAVVEQRLAEIVARARRAAASGDPAKAFREFMTWAAGAHVRDRCFCQAGGTALFGEPSVRALLDDLQASVEQLLRRAQEAGAIRGDVTAADLSVLVSAVAQAGVKLEATAPGSWRRYVDIVLDGLSPEGARPLSRKASPGLVSRATGPVRPRPGSPG